MNAASSLTVLVCSAGIGAGMLTLLIPQRRTKRILSFVLGLFLLVTMVGGVREMMSELDLSSVLDEDGDLPSVNERAYLDAVAQQTADTLVKALDELLREHGIEAENIELSVKISDEGRITADYINIYISEALRSRKSDIRSIVEANLSKEPHIYVQGQEDE